MKLKEYYDHYLELHQNKWCRMLHVFGQITTILFVSWAVYSENWLWLLLAPFVVYPFAWSGHFFFEKNKPAAFSNPIYAKVCDWLMLYDILRGKIK